MPGSRDLDLTLSTHVTRLADIQDPARPSLKPAAGRPKRQPVAFLSTMSKSRERRTEDGEQMAARRRPRSPVAAPRP